MDFLKGNKWTKKIGKSVNSISGLIFQSNEQNEMDKLNAEKKVLESDIEGAYVSIGRQVVKNKKADVSLDSGIESFITAIDEKLKQIERVNNQIIDIKKKLINQTILQEKENLQKEYEKEKAKLEEALNMDLITQEEFNEKLNERKKYIDNFDEIRRIKKQYEMNIISKDEMDRKIYNLLG
jgi:hypothetical protein